MDDEQLLRSIVQRGGDTTDLERGLSTFLVQLLFLFRTIPHGFGNLVKLALDFSPPVIEVELLLSFAFARGGWRLLQSGLVAERCCNLESPWATLHLHANI